MFDVVEYQKDNEFTAADSTGVPASTAWLSLLGVSDLDFLGFPEARKRKKPSTTTVTSVARFKHIENESQ